MINIFENCLLRPHVTLFASKCCILFGQLIVIFRLIYTSLIYIKKDEETNVWHDFILLIGVILAFLRVMGRYWGILYVGVERELLT